MAARRIAGGVTFSLPRGLAAQSVSDDVAESGSDPLVGGRVLVLERLEVVEHPIELGRWLPMLSAWLAWEYTATRWPCWAQSKPTAMPPLPEPITATFMSTPG